MSERTRNLAVGLTVIVALAMLCGMIVIFAGLPEMFRQGYNIQMRFAATADVQPGDDLHLVGMRIGKIARVRFTDPADPGRGVTFVARIDPKWDIPANVVAYIITKGLVGGAWIELRSDAPVPLDATTGEPEYLPRDGTAVVRGVLKGGSVIPDELLEAVKSLSELGKNLNRLIAPPEPASRPRNGARPGGAGLVGTVDKLNRTLDALHAVLGDAENRANFKTSLANLAAVTAQATEAVEALKKFAVDARKIIGDISRFTSKTGERVDELAARLIDNAEKISRLMTTMNKAAEKLESGEGSAGKLLNDPRLYNSLLEATRQLTILLKDFNELLKTWRAEGLKIRTK